MKAAVLDQIVDANLKGPIAVEPHSDLGCHFWMLYAFVIALGAEQVIELGVRRGASTVALLSGLDVTGGRLWSCDIKEPEPTTPAFVTEHSRWDFCLGDDCDLASSAPGACD